MRIVDLNPPTSYSLSGAAESSERDRYPFPSSQSTFAHLHLPAGANSLKAIG